MSELRALYQEVILDHYRSPRNFGPMPDATSKAEGYNPLCGDRVTVYVRLDGDEVAQVGFEGSGCAISTASASLMTEIVRGKTLEDAEEIRERFHSLLTSGDECPDCEGLGKLEVLSGVRDYPVRIKCATLAWHALHAALAEEPEPVSTE